MSAPPTTPPPPADTRTGAVAVGQRRRRPAWLIPLLAVALLALLLLALLFFLLRGSDSDKQTAGAKSPVSTVGAAAGTVPPGSVGTLALPPTPAASTSQSPSTPTAGAGTAGVSAPAALAGGGGIAARPAASASTGGSATGNGSAAPGAGVQGSTSGGQLQGLVLFATGSTTLDSNARQVVSAAADRIKAQRPSQVTVSGYTDNVGRQDSNAPLSQARAAAVAAALRSDLGTNGPTVSANGRGWTDFVASNASESGRQQNRRAAIAS